MDLTIPEYAHFYGMALTDGHFSESTRNRGKLSIEINDKDADLIYKYNYLFPKSRVCKRSRTGGNFGSMSAISFNICDKSFRDDIKLNGFPVGQKSEIVSAPHTPFSEPDFWRGVIDGDGSLGIVKQGFPFISLVTKSEDLANQYKKLILKICGFEPTTKRNTRDSVYNIMLTKESAVQFVSYIYYKGCFGLDRKIKLAQEIKSWSRPKTMKKLVGVRKWTNEEIEFIKTHSVAESQQVLGRSFNSVIQKLQRVS